MRRITGLPRRLCCNLRCILRLHPLVNVNRDVRDVDERERQKNGKETELDSRHTALVGPHRPGSTGELERELSRRRAPRPCCWTVIHRTNALLPGIVTLGIVSPAWE